MRFRIVVTDVTLVGPKRCVAGFDPVGGRMVRPEQAHKEFWPAYMCGENTVFHPGHVVDFGGAQPAGEFPHRTEDIVVTGQPRRAGKLSSTEFGTVLRKSLSLSPEAVFGRNLVVDRSKAYVPLNAPCGSLAALEVMSKQVVFHQAASFGGRVKPRAYLPVGGKILDLSITAKSVKQPFQSQGLPAAIAGFSGAERLHIRLGLARPLNDFPDRCYLQINGIYPI